MTTSRTLAAMELHHDRPRRPLPHRRPAGAAKGAGRLTDDAAFVYRGANSRSIEVQFSVVGRGG